MKKNLIACLLLTANCGLAQPYTFSSSTSTYSTLTAATSANGTSVWSYATSYTVPIGFTFNFMGNNYTSIYVEGGGFTYFDLSYNYILLPFGVALKDKGTSSSLSPISYKTEGSSPNRILKIEWNNADYFNNPGSTANFQLWLYETSNVIETHVGSCNVISPSLAYSWNSDTGPSIGIYEYSGTNLLYGFGLSGTPASPTENNNLSGAGINVFDYSLNGSPSAGAVYTFTPSGAGIETSEPNTFAFHLNQGQLNYSCKKVIQTLSIYDISGNLVHVANPGNFSGSIDCSFIHHHQLYLFAAIFSDGSRQSRKFFVP